MKPTLAVLAAALLGAQPGHCEHEMRTWTSAAGTTIQAKLIGQEPGKVLLEKEDGKQLGVSPALLSADDRNYLAETVGREKLEKMGLKTGQQVVEVPRSLADSKCIAPKYLLYLPKGYSLTGDKWPLVIFLHGMGERGTDPGLIGKHGPPLLAGNGRREFPCVLVSPQCRPDSYWVPSEVLKLVEHCEKTHNIDKDRLYITGLSMGGYGTWHTITEYPKKFAAAVPVCGGGHPARASAIRKMPVWAFHGAADNVVNLSESQKMVDALKALGSDVKFTVYPGVKHNSWSKAYADDEMWQWMFKQRR